MPLPHLFCRKGMNFGSYILIFLSKVFVFEVLKWLFLVKFFEQF